ncbi:putative btb poz domain protein [Phaeomoniella chlamydospora]|uniref:Putative btb poz domain protein n=1 Tax=Phaeomoniella chlamydospora TaxID=158046 RepID=A0A0G2GUI0_PHACM|nr:putative btb poz domain protein [Phaeomoniella chlamydospora]
MADSDSPAPSMASRKRPLSEEEWTDLTIVCKDQSFSCHKAIVLPMVPLFKSLCKKPFQGAARSSIDLSEDDPVAVKIMIQFIYTSELPKWSDVLKAFGDNFVRTVALVTIAKKYHIENMYGQVEQQIKDDLTASIVNFTRVPPLNASSDEHESVFSPGFPHSVEQFVEFTELVFYKTRSPLYLSFAAYTGRQLGNQGQLILHNAEIRSLVRSTWILRIFIREGLKLQRSKCQENRKELEKKLKDLDAKQSELKEVDDLVLTFKD